jgi:hypothetical protein
MRVAEARDGEKADQTQPDSGVPWDLRHSGDGLIPSDPVGLFHPLYRLCAI